MGSEAPPGARLVAGDSCPVPPSPGKDQAKLAAQERSGGSAPLPRHRRVFSDEGGKLSPFLPPEIFQKLQIAEAQSTRKYVGHGGLASAPICQGPRLVGQEGRGPRSCH